MTNTKVELHCQFSVSEPVHVVEAFWARGAVECKCGLEGLLDPQKAYIWQKGNGINHMKSTRVCHGCVVASQRNT